jgi:predicted transposase YdaD
MDRLNDRSDPSSPGPSLNILKQGLTVEAIAQATGLTITQIQSL